MKTISLTLAGCLALMAQTPAPKKTTPVAGVKKVVPAANRPVLAPRALLNPSLLKAKAPEVFKAKFTTTKGDFVVEAHRVWAPLGADRFYNLVKNGFFTNAAFFRVIPNFMAQFGLSAWPNVNNVWDKARMQDDPVKETNRTGYITFATAGPNTRTTQLFINYKDNANLDSQGFAPFGMVTEGMDVVTKIESKYAEQPAQDKITSEGKAYLDANFPDLDRITSARITEPASPAPTVRKPGPATTAKPAPAKPAPAKPAAK